MTMRAPRCCSRYRRGLCRAHSLRPPAFCSFAKPCAWEGATRIGVSSRGQAPVVGQPLWGTPARQHAQALADEWRQVYATVRLLEDRQRVKRDSFRASPTIVFRGATLPPPSAHNVETVMDSLWRGLGFAETKVRVTLVIELQRLYSSDTATPL